jgi:hypothetical protein
MADDALTAHDMEFEAERAVPYEEFGKVLWLGELARVSFAKDDIGVLKIPERLSQAAHDHIKRQWEYVMGKRRLLILDSGMELGVLALQDDSDGT